MHHMSVAVGLCSYTQHIVAIHDMTKKIISYKVKEPITCAGNTNAPQYGPTLIRRITVAKCNISRWWHWHNLISG